MDNTLSAENVFSLQWLGTYNDFKTTSRLLPDPVVLADDNSRLAFKIGFKLRLSVKEGSLQAQTTKTLCVHSVKIHYWMTASGTDNKTTTTLKHPSKTFRSAQIAYTYLTCFWTLITENLNLDVTNISVKSDCLKKTRQLLISIIIYQCFPDLQCNCRLPTVTGHYLTFETAHGIVACKHAVLNSMFCSKLQFLLLSVLLSHLNRRSPPVKAGTKNPKWPSPRGAFPDPNDSEGKNYGPCPSLNSRQASMLDRGQITAESENTRRNTIKSAVIEALMI